MTFEEKLDRMAERHEALAQSVEMLLVSTRANTENIGKLIEVTNVDAENIRALVRIVEAHERRITDIEDGKA